MINYKINVNKTIEVFKEEKNENIFTKEKLSKKENIIAISSLFVGGMLILLFCFYMIFLRQMKKNKKHKIK